MKSKIEMEEKSKSSMWLIHCEIDVLREVIIKFYEGPKRPHRSREIGNEEHYACFCPQEKCLIPK